MPLFRRRRRGRHEAVPVRRGAPQPLPVEPPPWETAPTQPWVSVVPAPEPDQPRVELGFRDGSMAVLPPDSAQARALTALADVLTKRD